MCWLLRLGIPHRQQAQHGSTAGGLQVRPRNDCDSLKIKYLVEARSCLYVLDVFIYR